MENTCDKEKVKNDLVIHVKTKRTPRLKSENDHSDKMTFVEVEVCEEQTETSEVLELKIHLQSGVKIAKVETKK